MTYVRTVPSLARGWRVLAAAVLLTAGCSEPAPPPPPPAPAAPPPKTAEARAQLYTSCWNQFNNKQFDQFQNCYGENAVSESVDSGQPPLTGRAAIIERAKAEAATFPDQAGEVRLVLVNGDNIAGVALFTATNTGEMPGPDGKPMKPTGKPVGLLFGHSLKLDPTGSFAVKEAGYMEEGTMMAQLGLSKAPARKAEKPTGAATTVVLAKNDATESGNVAATRNAIDVFNKHDAKALEANLATDYKLIEIAAPKDMNAKEAAASTRELFGGFPDVKVTASSVWAAGDYVVVEGTFEGTNTGNLPSMGVKKTGKPVRARYMQIFQYEAGKVKQEWLFYNGAAFAAQLGLK